LTWPRNKFAFIFSAVAVIGTAAAVDAVVEIFEMWTSMPIIPVAGVVQWCTTTRMSLYMKEQK